MRRMFMSTLYNLGLSCPAAAKHRGKPHPRRHDIVCHGHSFYLPQKGEGSKGFQSVAPCGICPLAKKPGAHAPLAEQFWGKHPPIPVLEQG